MTIGFLVGKKKLELACRVLQCTAGPTELGWYRSLFLISLVHELTILVCNLDNLSGWPIAFQL